jgi:hypothetical protein
LSKDLNEVESIRKRVPGIKKYIDHLTKSRDFSSPRGKKGASLSNHVKLCKDENNF